MPLRETRQMNLVLVSLGAGVGKMEKVIKQFPARYPETVNPFIQRHIRQTRLRHRT